MFSAARVSDGNASLDVHLHAAHACSYLCMHSSILVASLALLLQNSRLTCLSNRDNTFRADTRAMQSSAHGQSTLAREPAVLLSHHTSGDLRTVVEIFPPLAHGRLRSSARTRQCRASIGGRYGCPAQFAAAAGLILLPDIVERRVLSISVFVMSSCCQR